MYDKSTANIIPKGRELKAFPLRSGIRKGCPLFPLLFSIVWEFIEQLSKNEDSRVHGGGSRSYQSSVPSAQLGPYPTLTLSHPSGHWPHPWSDVLVPRQAGQHPWGVVDAQRSRLSSSGEAPPITQFQVCSSRLSQFPPGTEDAFLPPAIRTCKKKQDTVSFLSTPKLFSSLRSFWVFASAPLST